MRNITSGYKIALGLSLLLPFSLHATTSIGDAAENLMGPTEIITKLFLITCYIVGVALILGSIAQYKIHRESPKLVPLTTPILLLILGVITVLIPYGSKMFGESYSAEGYSKTDRNKYSVLPLPDTNKKEGMLPIPRTTPQRSPNREQAQTPNSEQSTPGANEVAPSTTTPPADEYPSETPGSGHWSNQQ